MSDLCSFLFFTQKTAYELRISDWSSDVCSSDLDRYVGSKICERRLFRRTRLSHACSDKWRGVEAVDPREDFDAFLGDPLRLSGIGRLRDIPRPGHAIHDDPLGIMAHAIDVRKRNAALFEQLADRGLERHAGECQRINPFIPPHLEGALSAVAAYFRLPRPPPHWLPHP